MAVVGECFDEFIWMCKRKEFVGGIRPGYYEVVWAHARDGRGENHPETVHSLGGWIRSEGSRTKKGKVFQALLRNSFQEVEKGMNGKRLCMWGDDALYVCRSLE